MLVPRPPVEANRPGRFRPPHCPWRDCPAHRLHRGFRWSRAGSYRRACDPARRVPRFRCRLCRRTFSRQSFACTYYLKRPELLPPVAAGLVAGSAHRQLARSLGCAPSTVTRLSARSVRATLDRLVDAATTTLELVTDDHAVYPAVIASHRHRDRIRQRVYPNPPRGPGADRAASRARDRAMFPVDLLHLLLRHSQAHHRRETIAFGRRANAVLERMGLLVVWRNFVKRRSERRRDDTTPAMRLGLAPRPFRWREIFARRLFPGRVALSPSWRAIYHRDLVTPAVGRNQRHRLEHAY